MTFLYSYLWLTYGVKALTEPLDCFRDSLLKNKDCVYYELDAIAN